VGFSSYVLSLEPHGVLCALQGAIRPCDLLAALESISAHPNFGRFKYTLYDLQQAHLPSADHRPLEPLLAFTLGTHYSNAGMLICAVATDQQLRAMLVDYQRMAGERVHLFSTLQAARQYIGQR